MSDSNEAQRIKEILLVDDDDALRRLLCVMIEQMGFRPTSARSGIDALEILDREGTGAFHALVTDIRMPRMTGLELAQAVRARRPAMPILFISGYAPSPDSLEDQLDEYSEFLKKPFSFDGFSSALENLLALSNSGKNPPNPARKAGVSSQAIV